MKGTIMASKKTVKPSDFKEFDTVVGLGEKLKAYWDENSRQIIAIALIVCLGAGSAAYWIVSSRNSARTAQGLLNQALGLMSASEPDKTGTTDPLIPATELLSHCADEYAGTEAGRVALFYLAQCRYRQEQHGDAIADYTAFLKTSGPMDDQLRPLAFENLGYAHEALGETNEALKWFEEAVQAGRSDARIGVARMHETAGAKDLACEAYKKFLADQADTGYREFVEIKIDALCRS